MAEYNLICAVCQHGPHTLHPCAICQCKYWVRLDVAALNVISGIQTLLQDVHALLGEQFPEAKIRLIQKRVEEAKKYDNTPPTPSGVTEAAGSGARPTTVHGTSDGDIIGDPAAKIGEMVTTES